MFLSTFPKYSINLCTLMSRLHICTNASVGCCRTPTSSTASPPWARRGPAWSVMQKVRRQNNYTAITRAEQLGRMKSGKWGMKYFLAELKYFLGDQTTRHAEEEPNRIEWKQAVHVYHITILHDEWNKFLCHEHYEQAERKWMELQQFPSNIIAK